MVIREIVVGEHLIGPGNPCFIIGEAGVNHNGDPDLAHALIDAAANAGADAVKFQTFSPMALVTLDGAPAPYQAEQGARSQHDMLKELALPSSEWPELAEHAASRGLVFLSTAFDAASADLVQELGVKMLKVPSGELDNLPFIRDLARRGLPLLISTGLGALEEVDAAVEAAQEAPALAVLHCVTAYPAPIESCNLRAIPALSQRLGVPVGWSDHTLGHISAVVAVALGAAVLEKHVTMDSNLPGPDHAASADPDEFADYVRCVRDAETSLGDGTKVPKPAEEVNRRFVRRSPYARRDLAAGDTVSSGDVVFLRPAIGLPANSDLFGRRVARAVRAGQPITAEDLAPRRSHQVPGHA